MRSLLRLALVSAVLLSLASVTSAAADREDRSAKGEKADKADKAERKADRDRGRGDDRATGHGEAVAGAKRDDAADDGGAGQAVGAMADQIAQPGEVRHPEHTDFGKRVAAEPNAGTVAVQVPGDEDFRTLAAGASIPVGSYVDASAGLVEIGAEASPGGAEQNAVVTGSTFRVGQDPTGMTILALKGGDFSSCEEDGGRATARSAARRKGSGDVARGIWAAGKGRFRTKGRHGAATVRGTRWSTVDRCHSTTVKVFEGVVDVSDFGLGRVVPVSAGERYVARERSR